jgi:hypothetical protein
VVDASRAQHDHGERLIVQAADQESPPAAGLILRDAWTTADQLEEQTGIGESTIRRRLKELADELEIAGRGVKNDPYRWRARPAANGANGQP